MGPFFLSSGCPRVPEAPCRTARAVVLSALQEHGAAEGRLVPRPSGGQEGAARAPGCTGLRSLSLGGAHHRAVAFSSVV